MVYSLVLVESNQIDNHSLQSAFDSASFQVITVSALPELAGQFDASLPDAVVVNEMTTTIDIATIRATIDDTNINIPCVSVADVAQKHTAGDANVITCLRKNVVKTLNMVLKESPVVRARNITLDTSNNTLWINGTCAHLTPKMAGLMRLLLQNEGKIVYRETIMHEIWETDYLGDTRTLDVHIRWLREKLEVNPSRPKILLTVRGAGYRLIAPEHTPNPIKLS